MSELERQLASDPRDADARARDLYDADSNAGGRTDPDAPATAGNDYEDPAVDLPGEDDYKMPLGDVGDSQRGQGLDHMGGYGNRPIPQEGGPDQDH